MAKRTDNRFEHTMNIYLKISAITLLIGIIVERNGLSEQEAITAFYQLKTAQKLIPFKITVLC